MNKSKVLIGVIDVLKKIASMANTINKTMLLKSFSLLFITTPIIKAKNWQNLPIVFKLLTFTIADIPHNA
jgi:uncharacterized protein involved in response to NO